MNAYREYKKKLTLFESATLRLTGWYVLLLMMLSLLFSLLLFNVASHEFDRALGPNRPGELRLFIDDDQVVAIRQQRVADSNNRLIVSLVFFNLAVLVGGTALSYLLARRTLRPVEEAHEAQTRFASDAAHELRTPLTVMQTEIEVGLRDTKATKQQHQAILESTLDEVERLRTLTDRLLLLAGQQEMPLGPVEIEDVVVEAVTHAVPLAQSKNIEVDNQVGQLRVIAHRDSLVNVLDILIDNAIKYSPEKTAVTIQSKVSEKWGEISVSDHGIGIAPEEHDKIFERFYRSDTSRTKEHVDGHGLGLSLAKRLVDEMGGEIVVASDSDKGATFTVRLPLQK